MGDLFAVSAAEKMVSGSLNTFAAHGGGATGTAYAAAFATLNRLLDTKVDALVDKIPGLGNLRKSVSQAAGDALDKLNTAKKACSHEQWLIRALLVACLIAVGGAIIGGVDPSLAPYRDYLRFTGAVGILVAYATLRGRAGREIGAGKGLASRVMRSAGLALVAVLIAGAILIATFLR